MDSGLSPRMKFLMEALYTYEDVFFISWEKFRLVDRRLGMWQVFEFHFTDCVSYAVSCYFFLFSINPYSLHIIFG